MIYPQSTMRFQSSICGKEWFFGVDVLELKRRNKNRPKSATSHKYHALHTIEYSMWSLTYIF